MLITLLKAKLHRACVTSCELDYDGSICIDAGLMAAVGIVPHERVEIWNINNGARISTYAIEAGSGQMVINGAAARHFEPGDRIIVTAFAQMTPDEASDHVPRVVCLDEKNDIVTARP